VEEHKDEVEKIRLETSDDLGDYLLWREGVTLFVLEHINYCNLFEEFLVRVG